jgi:hypothetical protein
VRLLDRLLDATPVGGTYGATREVATEQVAVCVDSAELADARDGIEWLCQQWGGACGPLLPVNEDGALGEPWLTLLAEGDYDAISPRELDLKLDPAVDLGGAEIKEFPRPEPLLAILAAQHEGPEHFPEVSVARPDEGDPWYIAYLGTLGSWPETPDEDVLSWAGLLPDLEFDALIRTERKVVEAPGPVDLVSRLRRYRWASPAGITGYGLSLFAPRRSADLASAPMLTERGWLRMEADTNVVVVYADDSVEDLALLWALRGTHQLPLHFPLGVPLGEMTLDALRKWTDVDNPEDAFAARLRGLPGKPFVLTSFSVPLDKLQELAEAAGSPWVAAVPAEMLQPTRRPARISSDLVTFTDGKARFPSFSTNDRDFFSGRPPQAGQAHISTRVMLEGRVIPRSATLRQNVSWRFGFRGGGHEQGPLFKPDRLMHISWPTGWEVIEALAADRGLCARVRPARPRRRCCSVSAHSTSSDRCCT